MVQKGGAVPDNAGTEAEAIVDSFEEELWYDASKITDMLLRSTTGCVAKIKAGILMDTRAVMNKLRAMLDLRKELLEAAAESPPVPVFEEVLGAPRARRRAKCPVSKFRRSHGLDHGDLARLLTGLGKWGWECPFCGAEFEE